MMPRQPSHRYQQGLSLIELMVALAVGMILTLAVFIVLAEAEGRKRTTTSINDSSQSGLYALATLDRMVRSAGTGFNMMRDEAFGCAIKASRSTTQLLPVQSGFSLPAPFASVNPGTAGAFKLAPILILPGQTTPGVSGANSDALVIMSGSSGRGDAPIPFVAASSAESSKLPAINAVGINANDFVLVASKSLTNQPCLVQQVKSPYTGTLPIDLTGSTYSRATIDSVNLTSFVDPSWVINLGPQPQFTLVGVGANNTLFTYDLLNLTGTSTPTAIELADGVFELRALYAIGTDTNGDRVFDSTEWVSPADTRYNLSAMNTDPSLMSRITAIRIGMILRTSLPEKTAVTAGPISVFDGVTNAAGTSLTYSRTLSSDEQHFRYRVLESTIPVRNNLL